MLYQLPYDYLPPFEIPDENLIGVFEAGLEKPSSPPEKIVRKALASPIGSPPLSDLAKNAKNAGNVLILCDDNTRYTPAYLLIPHVIHELHAGGIPDERIRFLIAKGSHSVMTEEMLAAKLGASVLETYTVDQHFHDAAEELVPSGVEIDGVPILINRRLKEADLVIGIGNIVPHLVKGFSGGCNIILPGVSGGLDAIGKMHWQNHECPLEEVLGVYDNKARRLINTVAEKAGLDFIVNTIVNNDIEILDAVAGAPVPAHMRGAEIALRVFNVQVPEKADIVIFDSYGNDLDFWQANKGLNPAYICMKQGGIAIMIADCSGGICHNISEIQKYGFKDKNKILELHKKGIINPIVSQFLLSLHKMIIEDGSLIIVSRGISSDVVEHVGFIYAETPKDALQKAFGMKCADASVTVLKHAGGLRPFYV
ncbi:nickel-dependent lactate racemase [Candidatus Latescibacterota bacterium]